MNEAQKSLVHALAMSDTAQHQETKVVHSFAIAHQALGAVVQDICVLQMDQRLEREIVVADINRAINAMGPLLLALCRWDALVGACPGGDPMDTILRGFDFALNTEARAAGVTARPTPKKPLYAHIGGDDL